MTSNSGRPSRNSSIRLSTLTEVCQCRVLRLSNQEFLQATKEEQQKTGKHASGLSRTAIILWNYLYLSKKIMDENDEAKRKQILKTIQSGSVVTWSHVHLHGEYDFSEEEKLRDFDRL